MTREGLRFAANVVVWTSEPMFWKLQNHEKHRKSMKINENA